MLKSWQRQIVIKYGKVSFKKMFALKVKSDKEEKIKKLRFPDGLVWTVGLP